MGALVGEPSVPLHVEDNPSGPRYASQNLVYCRECRHRFGGPYGAIASGVCDWKFCPYCGVEIAYRNPYHTEPEATWRGEGDWRLFERAPERWDDVIEGRVRERRAALPSASESPHAVSTLPVSDSQNTEGKS